MTSSTSTSTSIGTKKGYPTRYNIYQSESNTTKRTSPRNQNMNEEKELMDLELENIQDTTTPNINIVPKSIMEILEEEYITLEDSYVKLLKSRNALEKMNTTTGLPKFINNTFPKLIINEDFDFNKEIRKNEEILQSNYKKEIFKMLLEGKKKEVEFYTTISNFSNFTGNCMKRTSNLLATNNLQSSQINNAIDKYINQYCKTKYIKFTIDQKRDIEKKMEKRNTEAKVLEETKLKVQTLDNKTTVDKLIDKKLTKVTENINLKLLKIKDEIIRNFKTKPQIQHPQQRQQSQMVKTGIKNSKQNSGKGSALQSKKTIYKGQKRRFQKNNTRDGNK